MIDLTPAELQFIREAKKYLETPNFIHRVSQLIGKPIDKSLSLLPAPAKKALHYASQKAVEAAMKASLLTLGKPPPQGEFMQAVHSSRAVRLWHGAGSALTGAAGGLFGLPSFTVELPITTTLMLRSISKIAAQFGEDLNSRESQLECLYVFSLGGPAQSDDDAESAYYASRLVFSHMVSQAIHFLTGKTARQIATAVEKRSAPVLIDLVIKVASRFEITVGRKALSQLIPGIGAGVGAVVNVAFMEHFNETAKYHFGLRRLEREYGFEKVKGLYQSLR